jgi:glycosyltransferase involved in cell wall biosynthesis
MLTWSDWHTEPRSNRYHYAVRFARHLPVLFVQPDASGDAIASEKVVNHAVEILHVPATYDLAHAQALHREIAKRGIRRPLFWIYNAYFTDVVALSSARLHIYHATEDYLSEPELWRVTQQDLSHKVREMLGHVDIVLAVSDGVAASYGRSGVFEGDVAVLANGCDFGFWNASGASAYRAPTGGRPVALYQGGINDRLDFELLIDLADGMPDWDFWYCGRIGPDIPGWHALQRRSNVVYHGMLDAGGIARLAGQARVGLIPFKQDGLIRRSLPLKAYEYLACGLPVVTIPIDALAVHTALFSTATDSAGFEKAIRALSPSRDDANAVIARLAASQRESYDLRFEQLQLLIDRKLRQPQATRPRLNVLMLYDDGSTHVHTIKEHLDSFANYSRHRYHFLPATRFVAGIDDSESPLAFGAYDALVIHFSVRISIEEHLSPGIAEQIAAYDGPKLLFIQDEYDTTETARRWIERLGIDAMFTTVPLDQVELVYPRARFPHVDFLPTLTGYVPEDPILDRFVVPLAQRKLMIGYRGRRLPHQYGELGHEKYRIGVEMKRLAIEAGLAVDIEVEDAHRIYGTNWYRFLGSCRATLGTESGVNVFDDDGSLAALAAAHADMPYGKFAATYLVGREGPVRMNQVSPKIFEAIRLRTALILFKGEYSGVVQPDRHYIPLEKDFSNARDVFAKISDLGYVEQLTERAYDEVVGRGLYSYAAFVEGVDRYLESRCPRGARAVIYSTPVLMRYRSDQCRQVRVPSPLLLDQVRVEGREPRMDVIRLVAKEAAVETSSFGPAAGTAALPEPARARVAAFFGIVAKRLWRLLPMKARYRVAGSIHRLALRHGSNRNSSGVARMLRPLWRLLPRGLRARLVSRLLGPR